MSDKWIARHNIVEDNDHIKVMDEQKTDHPSFTFRAAQLKDVRGLAEVQVLSWKAAYYGQIPSSYLEGLSLDQKAKEWEKILQNNVSKTILAHKADAGIIGFINFGEAAIFIISSFATPSTVIKPLDFPVLFEPAHALACAA